MRFQSFEHHRFSFLQHRIQSRNVDTSVIQITILRSSEVLYPESSSRAQQCSVQNKVGPSAPWSVASEIPRFLDLGSLSEMLATRGHIGHFLGPVACQQSRFSIKDGRKRWSGDENRWDSREKMQAERKESMTETRDQRETPLVLPNAKVEGIDKNSFKEKSASRPKVT
jgi:hypothetical protein